MRTVLMNVASGTRLGLSCGSTKPLVGHVPVLFVCPRVTLME